MIIIQLFLVPFFTGIVLCHPLTKEPACSRFDYEEKLLAKTIQLENTVEELVKNRNELETKLNAELSKVSQEIEMLNTNIKEVEAKFGSSEEKEQKANACPSSYMYNAKVKLCWRWQKGLKLNWFDADKECSKQGAHLMILNTTEAFKLIQNYLIAVGSSTVFVGATDIMEESLFKWTNGDAVQDVPWGTDQPGGGTAQNCLVIQRDFSYTFNDRECGQKFELLCQFDL